MIVTFPKLVYAAAILCSASPKESISGHAFVSSQFSCRSQVIHCAQKLATDYTEDKRANMNRGHQIARVHDDPKTLPEFYVETCFEKMQ